MSEQARDRQALAAGKSSKIPVNRLRLQSFAGIRARRRPAFTRKFQTRLSIDPKRPFFSGALCHIVATRTAASRKEEPAMAPGPSSRSAMEIELTKLSFPRIFLLRLL